MKLKSFEFKTIDNKIVMIDHNLIPFCKFEYRINGEIVCKGTKREIQKTLSLTNEILNKRLSNSKTGRIKKKHELILIEGVFLNG